MTDTARDFIVQLLLEKGPLPDAANPDGYRYFDCGHIDSLGLIKFAFRIEERFNVRFLPQDIASEQFRTVGGLVGLIQSRSR